MSELAATGGIRERRAWSRPVGRYRSNLVLTTSIAGRRLAPGTNHPAGRVTNWVTTTPHTAQGRNVVARNRRSPENLASSEDLARVASEVLNSLHSEEADKLLSEPIREFLKRFRLLLSAAAQCAHQTPVQIELIGVETEWAAIAMRILVGSITGGREGSDSQELLAPALKECLDDCESEYSRCNSRLETGDRIGAYICNVAAAGCVVRCVGEAFTTPPTHGITA